MKSKANFQGYGKLWKSKITARASKGRKVKATKNKEISDCQ